MLFQISYNKKDLEKYLNKTVKDGVKKKTFHINESFKRDDFKIGDIVVTKFFGTTKFVARICKINKFENEIKEIKGIVLHVLKFSKIIKRGNIFSLDLCFMAVSDEKGDAKINYKIKESDIIWEKCLLNIL